MTTATPPVLTRDDLWQSWHYTPTDAQRQILDDPQKDKLVAGGWRGGKSQTASVFAATTTLAFIGRYGQQAAGHVAWFVANNYELTRAEYNYTSDLLRNSPIGQGLRQMQRVDPGEIRCPVPGGGTFTIKTKSASDPQTLAMEAPIFVVVCEAAQVSVDTFENLRGRVVEARQKFPDFGQLFLEGTFEGSLGWYASLWQKWQSPAVQSYGQKSYSLPTHTNTTLFPGGENDPKYLKLRSDTPESLFSEKYLGVPVPPSGRVHAAFDPAVHIRECDYDPNLPVYIGIDPGYSGQPSTYAVEAAQLVPVGETGFHQWRIFDEIAMNKFDKPGFSAQDVVYAALQRPWWKNEMKHGVIDVAGTQHNATNPDSNAEIWRKTAGIVLHYSPQQIKNQIDRVDLCLKTDQITGEPGLLIDPKCRLIVSEFGGGPNPHDGQTHVYSWPTSRQNEIIGKVPKDQYCDGIKAFAYLALNVQGPVFDGATRGTIRVKRRRKRTQ